MVRRRWVGGRLLLIWCGWLLVLLGLVAAVVALRGGFSLDLAHAASQAEVGVLLVGPPMLATIAWGRKAG
jgi:hypothetical protein